MVGFTNREIARAYEAERMFSRGEDEKRVERTVKEIEDYSESIAEYLNREGTLPLRLTSHRRDRQLIIGFIKRGNISIPGKNRPTASGRSIAPIEVCDLQGLGRKITPMEI